MLQIHNKIVEHLRGTVRKKEKSKHEIKAFLLFGNQGENRYMEGILIFLAKNFESSLFVDFKIQHT